LGELVLLDIKAKITHQIRPHLEHGGLDRIKAKVNKNIAARSTLRRAALCCAAA
jgi:hypothetical protein